MRARRGHDRPLAVGELRRAVRLDSEAIYRVRGWRDAVVEVEVLRARGLAAGQLLTLTREAVLAMDLVEPGADAG